MTNSQFGIQFGTQYIIVQVVVLLLLVTLYNIFCKI